MSDRAGPLRSPPTCAITAARRTSSAHLHSSPRCRLLRAHRAGGRTWPTSERPDRFLRRPCRPRPV